MSTNARRVRLATREVFSSDALSNAMVASDENALLLALHRPQPRRDSTPREVAFATFENVESDTSKEVDFDNILGVVL